MNASEQSPTRLISVEDLDASQVTVVEDTPHGALAVGLSAGKPFAVSNRCGAEPHSDRDLSRPSALESQPQ